MDGERFILAGRFIDGSGDNASRNVFLAVNKGIITDIGSTANLPPLDETAIDDFSHCTILPPLVDSSISLIQSPSVDRRVRLDLEKADYAKRAATLKQHIRYCHDHGVLGVADCAETCDLVKRYKEDDAASGKHSVIDIRTASNICRTPHDATDARLPGGDFLKIGYSQNIEDIETKCPQLKYSELCQILRSRGKVKAVVVANGQQQVKEALEAGCDAIEQGYQMGEDNLRQMAKKNVLWIPNVLRAKNALDSSGAGGDVCCRFSLRYVAPGKPIPGAEEFWQKMLAKQLLQLRFAKNTGITTAVGSGAGSVGILHGESMVDEMKLFIKAGYSQEETIRCASVNGARFFGMDRLGMLSVGRKATFLIARGTVKQLPRKLSYLEGIYIEGKTSSKYRKNPIKKVSD